jgi:chloramphenicol 3-O-phosphotransferase
MQEASRSLITSDKSGFHEGRIGVAAPVTEAEARELLRRCDGLGGLEAWIARQRWRTVPGG